MTFLITSAWVEGEARDTGIRLTARQVDAEFQRQRRAAFRTDSEFERFLRSTGQTQVDVRYRLRIDMLSARMQRHVSPEDLRRKWRTRTRCLPIYTVPQCGGSLPA